MVTPEEGEAGTATAPTAGAAMVVAEGGGGSGGGVEGMSHAERLEVRAAEVMDRVVGLAAFCDRAGAAKDLEVWHVGAVDSYQVPGSYDYARFRRLACATIPSCST